MVINDSTSGTGIEQMLKVFAAISGFHDVAGKLTSQIDVLTAEIAGLRGAGITATPKPNRWLKLQEAAAVLNTSPKTVRRYIERGLLARSAASRHILIPAEDVEGLREKIVV